MAYSKKKNKSTKYMYGGKKKNIHRKDSNMDYLNPERKPMYGNPTFANTYSPYLGYGYQYGGNIYQTNPNMQTVPPSTFEDLLRKRSYLQEQDGNLNIPQGKYWSNTDKNFDAHKKYTSGIKDLNTQLHNQYPEQYDALRQQERKADANMYGEYSQEYWNQRDRENAKKTGTKYKYQDRFPSTHTTSGDWLYDPETSANKRHGDHARVEDGAPIYHDVKASQLNYAHRNEIDRLNKLYPGEGLKRHTADVKRHKAEEDAARAKYRKESGLSPIEGTSLGNKNVMDSMMANKPVNTGLNYGGNMYNNYARGGNNMYSYQYGGTLGTDAYYVDTLPTRDLELLETSYSDPTLQQMPTQDPSSFQGQNIMGVPLDAQGMQDLATQKPTAGNYAAGAMTAATGIADLTQQEGPVGVEDTVDVVQDTVGAIIPIAGVFDGISDTGQELAASWAPEGKEEEHADWSRRLFEPHTMITEDWIDADAEKKRKNKKTAAVYAAKYGGNIFNNYAGGGNMFNNDGFGVNTMNQISVNEFGAGGTHEENPLGGIPQGIGANGAPNLVEQGELKMPDPRDPSGNSSFIVSAQPDMKITKAIAEENGLSKNYIGKTVRKAADMLLRKNELFTREGDTVKQNSIDQDLIAFMNAHEQLTAMKEAKENAKFQEKLGNLAEEFPQQMDAMMQPPQEAAPQGMPQGMPPMGMPGMAKYGGRRNIHQTNPNLTNNYATGGEVVDAIGSTLYGIGEGVLDTLTFGATDALTDKGYDWLRSEADLADVEYDEYGNPVGSDMGAGLRGIGNTVGAVGGGFVNPAAVGSAVSQGAKGVGDTLGATGNENLEKVGKGVEVAGQIAGTVVGANAANAANQAASSAGNAGEAVTKGNKVVTGLQNFGQGNLASESANVSKAGEMGINMGMDMATAQLGKDSSKNQRKNYIEQEEEKRVKNYFMAKYGGNIHQINPNMLNASPDFADTPAGQYMQESLDISNIPVDNSLENNPNVYINPGTFSEEDVERFEDNPENMLAGASSFNITPDLNNPYNLDNYVAYDQFKLPANSIEANDNMEYNNYGLTPNMTNPWLHDYGYDPLKVALESNKNLKQIVNKADKNKSKEVQKLENEIKVLEKKVRNFEETGKNVDKKVETVKEIKRKQSALSAMMQMTPIAMNLGMGLFGKKDKLELSRMNPVVLRRIDAQERMKSLGYDLAGTREKLRGAAGGQGGTYLGNMQSLFNRGAEARGKIYSDVERQNIGIDAREKAMNQRADQINLSQQAREKMYEKQAQAAQQNMLNTGFQQLAQYFAAQDANRLGADYAGMYSDTYDYTWEPFMEGLFSKKDKKGKKNKK